MTLRMLGLLLGLLPVTWWGWSIQDRCGPQGDAWVQCRVMR